MSIDFTLPPDVEETRRRVRRFWTGGASGGGELYANARTASLTAPTSCA
jgi:hypothetical protein